MNSKCYKGTKNDFSHFINMALQERMPWKILSFLLKRLAPTLNETREIICILLTELEALQSTLHDKEKEIENYQRNSEENSEETEQEVEDEDDHSIQTETMDDDLVEQGIDKDISFEVKEECDPSETSEGNRHLLNENDEDYSEKVVLENIKERDEELFTFVSTDNGLESETQVEKEENVIDEKVEEPKLFK